MENDIKENKEGLIKYMDVMFNLEKEIYTSEVVTNKMRTYSFEYKTLKAQSFSTKTFEKKKDYETIFVFTLFAIFVFIIVWWWNSDNGPWLPALVAFLIPFLIGLFFQEIHLINYRHFERERQETLAKEKIEYEKYLIDLAIRNKKNILTSKAIINSIKETSSNLARLKQIRTALYKKNIVFPKYRNYAAIASMYEYLMSERVETLDGVNGAYNLYESELRQNLIITNLNQISLQLNSIKDNQYLIYEAITESNTTTREILNVTKRSNQIVEKIENNTRIIKYNTLISALNSSSKSYLITFE